MAQWKSMKRELIPCINKALPYLCTYSASQWVHWSVSRTVSQLSTQLFISQLVAGGLVSQLVSHWVSQSFTQSVSQTVSQLAVGQSLKRLFSGS